jgi:hypothetical protein
MKSWAKTFLDVKCEPVSLDDVIKICQSLQVNEHHQRMVLLQNYEHIFDATLGEFNMKNQKVSILWILIVKQFMRMHTWFLDLMKTHCKKIGKFQNWWKLEYLKKAIPRNGRPYSQNF